jgi:hypothetical protein
MLLVAAIPEKRCQEKKALSYKDLIPLVLKVSPSWKSNEIVNEISSCIDLEQISYCVSDTGSNLTATFKLLKCKNVHDVNHKFSLILQSVFEKDNIFNEYIKSLSSIRTKKSMSRIARIVPPSQRVMNRFMNLMPLFEWGVKMIYLLDNSLLTEEEKDTLSFLNCYKGFILDTFQILTALGNMQKILKNNGFNKNSHEEAVSVFSNIKSENSLKIKKLISEYFADLTSIAEDKTICCSTDIIESCFGRYKEIVKGNKTVGISDLCLCIAAMMDFNNPDKTKKAMETVSIKKMREWREKNISKTLFAEQLRQVSFLFQVNTYLFRFDFNFAAIDNKFVINPLIRHILIPISQFHSQQAIQIMC